MARIPDDWLLSFFHSASNALENLDVTIQSHDYNLSLSVSDCRRYVLEKQKSILHQSIPNSNEFSMDEVHQRLARLKNETNLSTELKESMDTLDETARRAVCKLVLYNQIHWKGIDGDDGRKLQTKGTMDRSRLIEFIALNRTAMKLPFVTKYVTDGSPLFDDMDNNFSSTLFSSSSSSSSKDEKIPAAMKFPQPRLEYVQALLSRAVGWDPEFTTRELRRLFFDNSSNKQNEYSHDQEVLTAFRRLVVEMTEILTKASIHASQQPLSDIDEGGVTRVLSVQHSEVELYPEAGAFNANAPKKVSMDSHTSEEEQKRQIRLASEAAAVQQELIAELLALPDYERDKRLDKAKDASEKFSEQVGMLPPGQERISFLQSVDPETSRLLVMHKLWESMLAAGGGNPSMIMKDKTNNT